MKFVPPTIAPIVPIAAALVVGAACGGARPSPAAAGTAACVLAGVALASKRWEIPFIGLMAAAAFAAGAALSGFSFRQAGARLDATFAGEPSLALELDATLIAAAERDLDGRRVILVEAATNEPSPALRVRLEIADVPGDDAARIDALRRGDAVRVWCLLRAPSGGPGATELDARRRLAAARLDATARVKNSRLLRLVTAGPRSPGRFLDDARVRARRVLDREVGTAGETRAVLGAMLLGDRLLLDDDTNALLRDAGLVHILSISGLHTALTVLLVLSLLRRTGAGARGLLFVGTGLLLAFSAFVGHGASVWRAAASLGVGLLARVLSRDVDPLAALALAAGLLVAAVPALSWNIGFTLSVAATAGLLAACPPIAPGARRPSTLRRSMAASAGAYLATVPLLAAGFGRLAPVALLANLAAAPLCAACLAAGAATLVCSSWPVVGKAAVLAAKLSVAALLLVSRWAASVPGGHLRVAHPPFALGLAYVTLLLAAWLAPRVAPRSAVRAIRLSFVVILIALHLGPQPPAPGPARVSVLDVGQGLAVVVRGPDGGFVLVDAGPTGGGRFDAGDRIVVPALADAGCRRLDVLALSHDHDDHAGGARAVLRDLEVGELWIGAGSERDPLTRRVIESAVVRGVAVRRLKRGDRAVRAGLSLAVLHPADEDRSRPLNDRCLVLSARAPSGASILLPGDLEADGERALLAGGAAQEAGVLVAPHHGADGSSTRPFLERVAPRLVLVSAGVRNRFGHPGAAALARFAAVDAQVLRTDRDGTIQLTDAGGAWDASVEKQGNGDEGQDEDDGEEHRDADAPRP